MRIVPPTDRSLTPSVVDAECTSGQRAEAERLLLAAVVESSHDAIITRTLGGVITSWNAGAERLYGYTAEEAVGRPVTLIIPPERAGDVSAILTRLQRGEPVDHFETVRRHKDGRLVDVSLTISPLVAEGGTLLGASAIARDIGERKRLEAERQHQEAALRTSDERYRSLFAAMEQGFCIFELVVDGAGRPFDMRYLEVNPAFERQTGLRDAAGKTALELFGSLEEVWLHTAAEVVRTGAPIRYQDRVAALGRWFDVYFFRVGEPGERQVAAIFTDITAQRRHEAEREAFVAAMTHDLKSPLTTVQGATQLLTRRARQNGSLTADQLSAGLAPIHLATGRMAAMLNELLDVARIQQGCALDLRLADCDLVELSREVIAEAQTLTTSHKLQLESGEPSLFGRWDRRRLERVLRNLLANAVKYSPEGGEVKVAVRRDTASDEAVLTVTDSGVGIPADDLPDLFRAFRRGRNVATRIPGSGIGLVSVQQVVEQHGGSVAVESREGRGSTFTVRLPILSPAPAST